MTGALDIRASTESNGIMVEVLITIDGDRRVPDHDELAEHAGMAAIRLRRSAEAMQLPLPF